MLLSPPYVYVWDGGVAAVDFAFGVDGELIDFRSGELQIGISTEKPGEHCSGGFAGFGGFGGRGGGGCNPGTAGMVGKRGRVRDSVVAVLVEAVDARPGLG